MSLITSRRLGPLCLTQTCGAFNDNLVKNAMVVLAIFKLGAGGAGLAAVAGALFIAPYALLSATAGQLADRFDKSRLIQATKAAEVVLMAAAAWAFAANSVPGLLAILFGLGVQATMFGPLKYGILPDLLRDEELIAGNGLIEASTFLAILAGTVAGGALALLDGGPLIVGAAGVGVSLLGLAAAFGVPRAPAADSSLRIGWNILRETISVTRQATANRSVWLSILGLSWFWAIGATLLSEFPTITRDALGADGHVVTLLLTMFAVGVGIGSMLCSRLLHGEVSARYVPFAAFGITVFTWDFGATVISAHGLISVSAILHAVAGWRMLIDLLLLAMCGGLYSVPLYAIVQEQSEPSHRARTIAANNIINAVFMVAGAVFVAGFSAAHVSSPRVLQVAAVANFAVAVWIVRLLPQTVFRALFQWYFRLFHVTRIEGLENLAHAGARSILVINHLSFLDGCLVAAFIPGDIVFAIDTEQARRFWFLKYILDVFPVDPTNPMAIRAMVKAVRDGRRLAIFPEGRITLTGALMKIYDGPGLIADRADAAIIPVRIDGLQFHKTSRMQGKLKLRWFPHVSLTVLPPVRPEVPAALKGRERRAALGRIMQDIMTNAAFRPERLRHSLFGALLNARRLYDRGLPVVADIVPNETGGATLTELRYGRLILGSVVLGRKLAAFTRPGEHVGVMLPNAVGTLVTFFALQSQGRVPAMMNFTTGADGMLSCCAAAGIETILTSRRAVQKGKLERLVESVSAKIRFVYLEDVRDSIGLLDKLRGKLAARHPERLPGAAVDAGSPALVLFTSGSEGTPKGVVHSHRALLANCAQLRSVVDFNPSDRVFNALPMFHSFGMTATLLPLMYGVRVFLYPSPLHYRIVPEMVYAEQSTIMFGTDTFLTGYARKGNALDLQSLRYIFAGAEKVRPETRAAYMDHFKKPIFEGYGVTETAPVLALNTWGNARAGSVGRLLPGIEARLEPVPGIDDGGRLFVRGPNVMLGYLRADAPGVLEPPTDGWYDTGDIVAIDEVGFVTIKGRAKRFAKIGGEMVSLAAAEGLANAVWSDAVHAVITVPDARKGERLLLVTNQRDAEARVLLAAARERGVAEIQVPREVMVVDKVPLLGTGKIDYPAVQVMAGARTEREEVAA
ncbi:acyl-[ACP]--phospholipid O-acyltransferase [Acidisphaera sp. S103]|uniref:acyl-[ACP]--phospholipid O-acyltransferase n=1 Tax=Acidisphaera sp. S103 TaxID=1747223 RepID=UPI0015751324|nr:acyl-[ACP]--phospholipid O-acyltransferase [Acidisphaera sp. S103]